MPKALILGIGGQDGSYLADFLLESATKLLIDRMVARPLYEVHGVYRRSSVDNLWRIAHLRNDGVRLHVGDLADHTSIDRIVREVNPDEIYHLADQDHVPTSMACPDYSMDVTAGSVVRLLETVRSVNPKIKVFIPTSALIFGEAPPPQSEGCLISPQSPYAIAKASAYYAARFYRQHYSIPVSCGIMFNHDSPRRTGDYLVQKICRWAAFGKEPLVLGSADGSVDIGFAGDYVEAMWMMIQHSEPSDYCVSTSTPFPIRGIVELALKAANVDFEDINDEIREDKSIPRSTGCLHGLNFKIRSKLGWAPKVTMRGLVESIVKGYQERNRK